MGRDNIAKCSKTLACIHSDVKPERNLRSGEAVGAARQPTDIVAPALHEDLVELHLVLVALTSRFLMRVVRYRVFRPHLLEGRSRRLDRVIECAASRGLCWSNRWGVTSDGALFRTARLQPPDNDAHIE